MTKRVFTAIGISKELQNEISRWQEERADWPARWVKGNNLHITLTPPWHEENISAVADSLKTMKGKFAPFQVRFDRVEFGPDQRRQRLIWAVGKMPPEIIALKNKIAAVIERGAGRQSILLHLTLARFREENFADFPVKTLNEKIDWHFEAHSFLLMESVLKNTGVEYIALEEFKF